MLVHIGQPRVAERVRNAWLRTIEDGVHTPDVFVPGVSRERVGTSAFAEAVIARLGQEPAALQPARYGSGGRAFEIPEPGPAAPAEKTLVGVDVFVHWTGDDPRALAERMRAVTLVGVDVFVHWTGDDPRALAERMRAVQNGALDLAMITNRGVKVWPQGLPETALTDHWRCRYLAKPGRRPNTAMIAALQLRLAEAGVDFIKTEHLCAFGGVPGYSLGHGQ
jgi:isocitrate dehydrogenase